MTITTISFTQDDLKGSVISVDTSSVTADIPDDQLKGLRANQLLALETGRAEEYLIGLVSKVIRKKAIIEGEDASSCNTVSVLLIGTYKKKHGSKNNLFTRNIELVPEIASPLYSLSSVNLGILMSSVSNQAEEKSALTIGKYSLATESDAFICGNKFFQRHAAIVGSTGSGKSWLTAMLLEQISNLDSSRAILFDIHGEYKSLESENVAYCKIAGPAYLEKPDEHTIFLPYWLLSYEEIISMFVDRSDNNAPNQAMMVQQTILKAKQEHVKVFDAEMASSVTIDSPVPYDFQFLMRELSSKDTESVQGVRGSKQGPFNGKLTRLIARLNAKTNDKRWGFLFNPPIEAMEIDWLDSFISKLFGKDANKVTVIDFSEVPSDILPTITSMVARLIFNLQVWSERSKLSPIAILCDEAHLYINDVYTSADTFQRIAKEGRKYGVGLVVISQRPSEIDKTVLSQCNNFISMRLTNPSDQLTITKLLPENIGGICDVLPILDAGEALVVGDASILPSRIKVLEPNSKPLSNSLPFWDEWRKKDNGKYSYIAQAIKAWRIQSITKR